MRHLREDGTGFIGRVAELTRLGRAWERVRSGRSELLLVAGEAGVGKTRLMREFVDRIGGSEVRLLWGECIDLQQGGLPYAPFRQALRTAARDQADIAFVTALRAAGPDLAMLLPSLGESASVSGDDEIRRVRLFESLLHLLRRLAERQPVLFVVEDAHWADDTTLDLVTFLSRNLSDSQVLLLLTFRPGLVVTNPALQDFLASRAGRTVTDQFTLNGFAEAELASYLAELIDEEPRPAFVGEIARRSNGNPLFAREIVVAERSGTGIPPSLNQLLLGRITGLPADVRTVLRIAAVAGHAIPYDVLQTVTGLGASALTAALRRAIDADVLVEDATIGGYAFRHALLQEALYSSLLLHERQELHHGYANALAGRSDNEPLVMGAIATHWDRAGEAERALRAYVLAADAARHTFSFADVQRYLARAFELWNDVADAAAVTALTRRHLANRLVDACVMVEDTETAVAVAREAAAMVDTTRDPDAAAFQRGQLAVAHWFAGEESEGLDGSKAALDLLDNDVSVERARVLTWRAQIVALNGSYKQACALAQNAMAVATEAGAPKAYRIALATCGSVMARQGDLTQGWRYLDHAELLARMRNDTDEIMRMFILRGRVLQAYGRWAEAADNYSRAISEAAKYGMSRRYVWRFHVLIARMLFQQGHWHDAMAEIYQAREHTAGRQAALPPLLIATGEFSAAAEFYARQRTRWRSDGVGLLQLPEGPVDLAVWQRRYHEARERYEHGLHLVDGSEELMPEARLCVAALRGEADAVRSGEDDGPEPALDRATRLIERLRALGAARPSRPDGFGSELSALAATGEAEYLRLRAAHDPQAWAGATDWWDSLVMPYPAAYTRLRHAEALVAQDDRRDVEDLLADALATATRLGAVPLGDAIRAAQSAAGVVLPAQPEVDQGRARTSTVFGLTEREREVAGVLARGLSNREIAEQLFIAEGTASVHVSRILRKLGVTSRGQAIAVLLQEGVGERG